MSHADVLLNRQARSCGSVPVAVVAPRPGIKTRRHGSISQTLCRRTVVQVHAPRRLSHQSDAAATTARISNCCGKRGDAAAPAAALSNGCGSREGVRPAGLAEAVRPAAPRGTTAAAGPSGTGAAATAATSRRRSARPCCQRHGPRHGSRPCAGAVGIRIDVEKHYAIRNIPHTSRSALRRASRTPTRAAYRSPKRMYTSR